MDISNENTCRICLGDIESTKYSIFQELDCDSSTNIDEFLMSISDIKLSPTENFPHTVCTQCYNSILFAFDLRLKCNKSQLFFDNLITNVPIEQPVETISDSDFEKEDTTDASFITPLVNDPNITRQIDYSGTCTEIWDQDANRPNITCETCGKVFHTKSGFRVHYQTHLPDFYLCHVCNHSFKLRVYFVNHLKAHEVHEKTFVCDFCGRKFQTRTGLRMHALKHTGQCYDCNICNKKIGTPSGLMKHNRIYHSTEKPYLCTDCGQAFPLKMTLTRHTRTNHSEKQYLCSECGKAFSTPSLLANHKLMHSNVKKFTCKICHKSFKRGTTLRTHTLVHEGKKYECEDCGKKFIYRSVLRNHQKVCNVRKVLSDEATNTS